MTEERVRFETTVPGLWGWWPATPALWSYSSLKEMEACPRRWMLSRAEYPDVWERRGYPSLPIAAAIFGNVVHCVVELLTNELQATGIASTTAGEVVRVLSLRGGWRGIITDSIDQCLSSFEGNPRVSSERLDRVRGELVRRAPDAADQVKSFMGRGGLLATSGSSHRSFPDAHGEPKQRYPAGPGAHIEREVTADELRLTGRIDLLTISDADVVVTDFKTGAEDEAHEDQVRLYALLWDMDRLTNPERRPATQLRVVYPSHERDVVAPNRAQLQLLESVAASRVAEADTVTMHASPQALPSEANCKFCQVKQFCDEYWSAIPPALDEASPEDWFDYEGRVLRRNGSRSWYIEDPAAPAIEVLIRTPGTDVAFPIGGRVRLLGVRRSQDPDDLERMVISMVGTSEWYPVSS